MNKTELQEALNKDNPSPDFTNQEKALWLTYHDQWEAAHDLIQSEDNTLSSLIHGYLHHVEGDHGNGDYWYRRSGYHLPSGRQEQWEFIVARVAGQ